MNELELSEDAQQRLRENGWVPKIEVLREVRRLLKADWNHEEIVNYLDNAEDFPKGAF